MTGSAKFITPTASVNGRKEHTPPPASLCLRKTRRMEFNSIGVGNYKRRCEEITTTGAVITTPTSSRSMQCVPRENHCQTCRIDSCVQCRDQHYLLDGECVESCPPGYNSIGVGNYNRICEEITTTGAVVTTLTLTTTTTTKPTTSTVVTTSPQSSSSSASPTMTTTSTSTEAMDTSTVGASTASMVGSGMESTTPTMPPTTTPTTSITTSSPSSTATTTSATTTLTSTPTTSQTTTPLTTPTSTVTATPTFTPSTTPTTTPTTEPTTTTQTTTLETTPTTTPTTTRIATPTTTGTTTRSSTATTTPSTTRLATTSTTPETTPTTPLVSSTPSPAPTTITTTSTTVLTTDAVTTSLDETTVSSTPTTSTTGTTTPTSEIAIPATTPMPTTGTSTGTTTGTTTHTTTEAPPVCPQDCFACYLTGACTLCQSATYLYEGLCHANCSAFGSVIETGGSDFGRICAPLPPDTTTSPSTTEVETTTPIPSRTCAISEESCVCTPDCFFCNQPSRECVLCLNSTYLYTGECYDGCSAFVNTVPEGQGALGRVCSNITTTTTTSTTSTPTTTLLPTAPSVVECFGGITSQGTSCQCSSSCAICNYLSGQENNPGNSVCTLCMDSMYLMNGVCVLDCGAGFSSVGTAPFGRICSEI